MDFYAGRWGIATCSQIPIRLSLFATLSSLDKNKASPPAKALRGLIHKTPRLSDIGPLPWWDAKLADRRNELAFIWTGDLRFRMLNDDFAGHTTYETAILYYNDLREGL